MSNTTRSYLDARNRGKIQTGDLVCFEAIGWQGFNIFSAAFWGWLANRAIRRFQWLGSLRHDRNHRMGFFDFIHVGFVVRKENGTTPTDEVVVYEYQAGMDGLIPTRLSDRVRDYQGRVVWCPLTATARRGIPPKMVQNFIDGHRKDKYNYGHLLFAEANWLPFTGRDGGTRKICSEACVSFWKFIGAIDAKRRVWTGAGLADKPVLDHHYSVREVMQHCAIDNSRIAVLEKP